MRTEELTFYHGTGADAARALLVGGGSDSFLEKIGAFELGREIWRSLLHQAGLSSEQEDRLLYAYKGPGSEYSNLWFSALRQVVRPEAKHLFVYGHFFATLNLGNAYRYALSPYRSEFLLALAKSLEVLEDRADPLPTNMKANYPLVAQMLTGPSPPVVLELQGISAERLLTENGGADLSGYLNLYRRETERSGVSAPLAFRVRDVKSADIVAVHDLQNWPVDDVGGGGWQPEPNRVAAARQSAADWLAKHRA